MQNSEAYIQFVKQINAIGREKMDGYAPQTLENIYDWERELVEDIIWCKFVNENDSGLAMFMPKLTKYNGIEALRLKLDEFVVPSGGSFNIAETLYVTTNENRFLRVLIENYNETSDKATKMAYVSHLSRLARKQEIYAELINIYINDNENVNQSISIQGILWADGYLGDIDDMDEIIKNIQLLRMFNKERKEDRNSIITDYKNGEFECYRR